MALGASNRCTFGYFAVGWSQQASGIGSRKGDFGRGSAACAELMGLFRDANNSMGRAGRRKRMYVAELKSLGGVGGHRY